ncbi:MAG: hypothetical protein R2807_10490 [Chitinophagales bacterium]
MKKILINKLKDLAALVEIVDSTKQSFHLSFDADFTDFEDAIQYYTAIEKRLCVFNHTQCERLQKRKKYACAYLISIL